MWPPGDDVLLLTDRAYLPDGTLRALLAADDRRPGVADDRVHDVGRAVALDEVVQRAGGLDVELDRDLLSPEDELRVAIARVLLAAPRFVLLTRPAAGVGATRAADVLAALAASGTGYLVLGDEALAPEHFDAVVAIAPDGSWTHTVVAKGAA